MPTLKQLTAHILHGHSTVSLPEYGTTYTDGSVTTYIAIPSNAAGLPVPFSIKLTSSGYIAPGLAMFVFIDGVYQCNRNREDLEWDVRREIERRVKRVGEERGRKGRRAREREEEERRERRAREVEFVVRQKEERGVDGAWVGRPWRFEKFRIVNAVPDLPDVDPGTHFAELGDIVVLVLRCVSKKDKPDADSDSDSDAPRSAMAPSFDLDDSDSESNSEDDIPAPKGKDKASMQATVEDAPDEALGGLGGMLGNIFDGDNTGYYGQHPYYPYQSAQGQNWGQQPWQPQNQQLQQWNAYTQQWEPVPAQYLQPPLQYDPGYTSQPQYVYYSAPEQNPQPTPAPYHRCPSCGNTGPHEASSQHRSSRACQSCGNPNPKPRSLSQHLHSNAQTCNTVPAQTYTAPQPVPPPPPPPAQPPQRRVHWADQQPQSQPAAAPHVQAIRTSSTQPQAQPKPQQPGPMVVPPRHFPGVPTYTYIPGQGYYHDHTSGAYVIEDGYKVYSECEECKKAAEERRKSQEQQKGKGKKKKKGKGKGEKDEKDGEKNEKGKGKRKSGKKGTDKEKKDDNQEGDSWGGGDSWGDNNDQNNDNTGDNNTDNNGDTGWGNSYNSGGWDNNNNWGNGDQNNSGDNWGNGAQNTSGDNWDSAPQPSPSPAQNSGDQFASGDPYSRSQNQSRSHSRSRNHRDPSPTRSHHSSKPNPILANPLEDADEFVTPMYRDPVLDEPPLYTVPEHIAKEHNLTHQVQMGRSLPYFHKIRTPRYLDTLEEPYARFVFKYRQKDVIENMFKVTVARDVEAERKVLEALPRDQIVETLLRTQGLLPTAIPVKRLPSKSRTASRSVSWNLNANNPSTTHAHNQTHVNSSSHTRPQTAHTSPARNDTNSFAGALIDKLSAVNNSQDNWGSNSGNSWDNNNATTSGDPFTSRGGGGGDGGWKGNTAYNSPERQGSPAQEESQW